MKPTPLTSKVMAQILTCATAIGTLSLQAIRLQRAVPRSVVRPWVRVRMMGDVKVESWVMQTGLMGKTSWEFDTCTIKLTEEQVRVLGTDHASVAQELSCGHHVVKNYACWLVLCVRILIHSHTCTHWNIVCIRLPCAG